jgi:hypothetical protein
MRVFSAREPRPCSSHNMTSHCISITQNRQNLIYLLNSPFPNLNFERLTRLEGALKIIWSSEIDCCGRIIWTGPCVHFNKPEKRRYCLWLKNTAENVFLRQQGIKGLADHEIGTHYVSLT